MGLESLRQYRRQFNARMGEFTGTSIHNRDSHAADAFRGLAVRHKTPEEPKPGFAHDPERVARFRREAQLLAAVNHPHIAAIYRLEESNGSLFLVLELVEGGTLAERLKAGPLPVGEALTVAGQVADACQAAHEKGIMHRDLKPANVKITPEEKSLSVIEGPSRAIDGQLDSAQLKQCFAVLSTAACQ